MNTKNKSKELGNTDKKLIISDVMRSFSIEDLRKAFEAGQRQVKAEWDNDTSHTIGYYNGYADDTFESWIEENYA